ncbi:hypothetical protein DFH06DRAFT_1131443 [Mycena polygramma]|nr:hypothetical protein DFH06DRAFT_1131443 [Mycena polygramma]
MSELDRLHHTGMMKTDIQVKGLEVSQWPDLYLYLRVPLMVPPEVTSTPGEPLRQMTRRLKKFMFDWKSPSNRGKQDVPRQSNIPEMPEAWLKLRINPIWINEGEIDLEKCRHFCGAPRLQPRAKQIHGTAKVEEHKGHDREPDIFCVESTWRTSLWFELKRRAFPRCQKNKDNCATPERRSGQRHGKCPSSANQTP